MPESDPDLMTVFTEALERIDPAERAAYLNHACGDDVGLRARVEALLAAHAGAGRFLDPDRASTEATSSLNTSPLSAADATEEYLPHKTGATTHGELGSVIAGRYTLVDVIGEGGMGSVYLVDQTEPVKRQVALKLIKAGIDSRGVLARFDAERQALALMDHPNIARIYDGGVTERGQPFFVMELVRGVPLTKYCDHHQLTMDARLQLFVSVCQAVQHAHQKGIIHRDLKPGNVLVADVDGNPTPKVIDFGVAKATEQKLTDMSFADTGAIVGTPAYMSPEQAEASLDIDTRTDVYALGVILYELLTGSPPIDTRQFRRGAILEMLRMVREVDPPKPSTRVSTADALPNIAAARRVDPAQLKQVLTGDLDWIVMKALEKDRTRRYETANGFAADVLRHLAYEPVVAAPPSRIYRLQKFVRKNRAAVLAASLVLVTLLAGIAGTTVGLIRAAAGERLAGVRLKQVEAEQKNVVAEKQRAETEKAIAQAVNEFLQKKLLLQANLRTQAKDLLAAGEQASEAKVNPTIRELLDRAARELADDKIEANFPNQPEVQAAILRTVGNAYQGVGDFKKGVEFLERSRAIIEQRLGSEHPDTLGALDALGYAYLGVDDSDRGLLLLEKVFELRKAKLGPDHADTLVTMSHLTCAYLLRRKPERAVPLAKKLVELQERKLGRDDPDSLSAVYILAAALFATGNRTRADALSRELLERRTVILGPDHPDTLMSINEVAGSYMYERRYAKAAPLLEEALKLLEAKAGPDDPDTIVLRFNLARSYWEVGKQAEALPLFEKTLDLQRATMPNHDRILHYMLILGEAYWILGNRESALQLFAERLELEKARLGIEHPTTMMTMQELAQMYIDDGKHDRALPLLEELLKQKKARPGPDHPDTIKTMQTLVQAYVTARKPELALPHLHEMLEKQTAQFGSDHPSTFATTTILAECYLAAEQIDEAVEVLEELLRVLKAKPGREHPATVATMNQLAVIYQEAGQLDKALELNEQILEILKAKLGPDHPNTRSTENTATFVRRLLTSRERYRQELATHGPKHINTVMALRDVAQFYIATGDLDQAQSALVEVLDGLTELGPDDPVRAFTVELVMNCFDRRKQKDPNGWATFNAMSLVGGAQLGQNKYDEAEPLLLEGYAGLKQHQKTIPTQGATRIPEALDRLIELYTATNKPDEMAKWRNERAKYPPPFARPTQP